MINRIYYFIGVRLTSAKSVKNIIAIFCVCLSNIFLYGCFGGKLPLVTEGANLPRSNITAEALQNQLDDFEEIFTSRTKAAAAEIDRLSADPKIIKMTLLWRSKAIASLHNILEQPKPIVVMVDCWLLCKRLTNYIESGEAANIFGQYQPVALAASKEIESNIESIASEVLSEKIFTQTSDDLRNLALANPIQSGFSKTLMYSMQIKKGQPGLLESVISIPLSPVRALEGVDKTPAAIYDFSTTTKRLTDIVQELPESTRWQLLLSLYDLEETEMAKSFLKSLQNISDSSNKLSAAVEKFPAMLEDSEKSQGQIRQTLDQIGKTSVQLQELFESARQTAIAFSQTATDVNMVVSSWTLAAQATDNAISRLKPQTTQTATEAGGGADFKETAQAVREAANEIRLVSEGLPNQTEQMVMQIDLLARRITVNIAILMVLLFCILVIYLFIRRKLRISIK